MELEGSLVYVGTRIGEVYSVNESELTVVSTVMSARTLSEFICVSESVLVAVSVYIAQHLLTLLIWSTVYVLPLANLMR